MTDTAAGRRYVSRSVMLQAIGVVDSRLQTVGVFSAEDVKEAQAAAAVGAVESDAPPAAPGEGGRSYERGVVFYTREKRVVGILLWNLFNRMHVARQVSDRQPDVVPELTPHARGGIKLG